MRDRLLNAPWWVLSLVSGASFGLLWTVWRRLVEGDSWSAALVQGTLLGIFFGAVMGPVTHRQNRGLREAAAHSPEGLSRRVRRAAFRGPVPADPAVRDAARRVVVAQLRPLDGQRWWGPLFFVFVAALGVALGLSDSPWWFVPVPFWIAAAWGHVLLRRHLHRRAALLNTAPEAGSGS
jgi:hypothetical protein